MDASVSELLVTTDHSTGKVKTPQNWRQLLNMAEIIMNREVKFQHNNKNLTVYEWGFLFS